MAKISRFDRDENGAPVWTRQAVIPGTAPDVGGLLRQKAAAPLKPKTAQRPCDAGLFGDSHQQKEMKL